VFYVNMTGILSELGAVDEALEIGRVGWTILRRTRNFALESYVHLFWRRGDMITATLLLGASDAGVRAGAVRQVNETRLIAQARPALEAALGTQEFARLHAQGEAFDDRAIVAAITSAIG
jgi:hypothetical protein